MLVSFTFFLDSSQRATDKIQLVVLPPPTITYSLTGGLSATASMEILPWPEGTVIQEFTFISFDHTKPLSIS